MEEGRLVTLEQCYDSAHAHILRGLLETNDIPCFMNGEHHNSLDPLASIGLGGIRIMVHENDFERARFLLTSEKEEDASFQKPFLQKPYLKTLILGIAGFFLGAPVLRAKGKHEQ